MEVNSNVDKIKSLHEAIWAGDEDGVSDLLAQGVNTNPYLDYWPLLDALKSDDLVREERREKGVSLRIAQLLILQGANINATSSNKKSAERTLLFFAIEEENLDFFNFFLNNDCNVNVKDIRGLTPLHLAVKAESPMIYVEPLLERGAYVNTDCNRGCSPLHFAAGWSTPEVTQLLINKGANINAKDSLGQTPLHYCILHNKEKIFELLIKHKDCNVDLPDNCGQTPLLLATRCKTNFFMELLLNCGSSVDTKCNKEETPLHITVNSGALGKMKLLLEKRPNQNLPVYSGLIELAVNGSNRRKNESADCLVEYGFTVSEPFLRDPNFLFRACKDGYYKLVKYLLEHGGDPNFRHEGKSLLDLACELNCVEMGQILVNAGADVNNKDHLGQSVLFYSIQNRKEKFFDFILSCGADVNISNKMGVTPLHLASKFGTFNYLKPLIKKGAQLDALCNQNKTPLHIAVKAGLKDTVQALLECHTDFKLPEYNTLIHESFQLVFESRSAVIREISSFVHDRALVRLCVYEMFFMEMGIPFKRLTKNNISISDIMSRFGMRSEGRVFAKMMECRDIFILLLTSMKPDIMMPLMISSVMKSVPEILELLLGFEHGINLNSTICNTTILHFAEQHCPEALSLLCLSGGDINVKDSNGNTPLHYACRRDSTRRVKLILSLGGDIFTSNHNGPTDVRGSRRNAGECLKEHFASLVSSGLSKNFTHVVFSNYEKYLPTYLTEVETLKRSYIPGSRVSFYEILKSSEHSASRFMGDPLIIEGLNSFDLEDKFPKYGKLLESKIKMAQLRRAFLDETWGEIFSSIGFFSRLQAFSHIKDHIFSFVTTEELRIINGYHGRRETINVHLNVGFKVRHRIHSPELR